jgi:predicted amidophosphoribosyltransferase
MSTTINVEVCGICKFRYDSKVRAPMILCPKQHIYCQNCFDRLLSKEGSVCPDCQHQIDKENVAKFRLYPKFESKMQQINQAHR